MAGVASITIKNNNTKEFISAMKEQVLIGLKAIGQEAEGFAKDECPVDTGNLRNSISNEVVDSESAVYVGTNVEYAPFVELGEYDHKVGKSHFLRDAMADHGARYESIMEAALKS